MDVFVFSLTAALNPTLLAATTVMLLADHPKRLLVGYLLGAMLTSITLGLVIVFSLEGSSAVSTTQNTLSPAADLALGAIALIIAFVLGTGRSKRFTERRRERKSNQEKGPPRWQQFLNRGTARVTFAVGAALTLPGASYLVGLNRLAKDDLSTAVTVLAVLGFNLVMLSLLEVPLLSYVIAPDTTPQKVDRFKGWLGRKGNRIAVRSAIVIGALLIIKGAIGLLS
jgi:ABC-type multidrug transport system fused ATPase/permease subunit